MNLRRYFTLPVHVLGVLGSVLSTSAQQNSTQVTVSSVVTCVSTSDQRQHCAADTNAGVVMLRPTGEAACLAEIGGMTRWESGCRKVVVASSPPAAHHA